MRGKKVFTLLGCLEDVENCLSASSIARHANVDKKTQHLSCPEGVEKCLFFLRCREEVSMVSTLQMKGRWESNINVWLPFMYSLLLNWYFQYRTIMFSLPVPTFIYLWEIYIFPGSVCLFCCREICGPIMGIYKSLTYKWMWKLGLRPRYSQKRNI